ncbi:MAG: hypothetical protein ACYTEE_00620, partial [Planctomycetota bacterium]
MNKFLLIITVSLFLIPLTSIASEEFRRLHVKDYVDKMKAGWIGQMAGVGWGGPTEFGWRGTIIPEDKMPKWSPEKINQFRQDDIYVEMTFLRTLELHGLDVSTRQAGIDFANSGYMLWHANKYGRDNVRDVSTRQAGIDFANSGYMLWHANKYGRDNVRDGIAPPDSGHPKFSAHADDIDYQIEADYAGLISPGLPNV